MPRAAHVWDGRVESWQAQLHAGAGFTEIRQAVLGAACPTAGDTVIDLGAGTGFLTLPLAVAAGQVIAVDLAPKMLTELSAAAAAGALTNITTVNADLAAFDVPAGSADLVVSNYALHHLPDRDKAALLHRASDWLRPAGRLVIADMMFGRGSSARDRAIIAGKVATLARKGPAGWGRIAKNTVRFGLRVGSERPAAPEFWRRHAALAGFVEIRYQPLIGEAGLLTARVASAPRAAAARGTTHNHAIDGKQRLTRAS